MARDGTNSSGGQFRNWKPDMESSQSLMPDISKRTNFRQSSKLLLQNCDGYQISASFIQTLREAFTFEVKLAAQASHKATIINRGLHREILSINMLQTSQVLVVHQDKIEVIEEGPGAGMGGFVPGAPEGEDAEESSKPVARTLMQYEEPEGSGFGGANDQAVKASWLVSATIVDVGE